MDTLSIYQTAKNS